DQEARSEEEEDEHQSVGLDFLDPAREALVGLLPGKVIEVAVTDQRVGRFVVRRAQLLRDLLRRAKSVRHKNRVLPDALPKQSCASDSTAWTLHQNAVAIPDAGALRGRGMNLHQTAAVHLLTQIGPLRHPREMHDARPPYDPHQGKFLVNLA